MRVMPFLTAPGEAVQWEEPQLRCHNQVIRPGSSFTNWDYLSEIDISLDYRVDRMALVNSLTSSQAFEISVKDVVQDISLVLQIECPSTQHRQLERVALRPEASSGTLNLTIPSGTVAGDIQISAHVVLMAEEPGWGPASARYSGSRLVNKEPSWKVVLEGEGSSFPMSAFSFTGTGYPEKALWFLKIDADRLEEPFAAGVRLFINAAHSESSLLLGTGHDPKAAHLLDMLKYDLLATMLESVADLPADYLSEDFDEGSTGAVLSDLAHLFVREGLAETAQQIQNDRGEFRSRLQSELEFLDSLTEAH